MNSQQLDDFECLAPLQQQLFQAGDGRFYADWRWLLVSCAGPRFPLPRVRRCLLSADRNARLIILHSVWPEQAARRTACSGRSALTSGVSLCLQWV